MTVLSFVLVCFIFNSRWLIAIAVMNTILDEFRFQAGVYTGNEEIKYKEKKIKLKPNTQITYEN